MAKSMCVVILAVVVAAVVALAAVEAAPITCSTVANDLSPCINFVVYGGVTPPAACCNGARALFNQAKAGTVADRQAICTCVKSVAGNASPAIINNAAALPGKCDISIPYKISLSTDCSKIR